MGDSVPQLAIPKLIEFYKEGKLAFNQLVKFYDFEEINQATADSNSRVTIKPILIIVKSYRKEKPLPH